LFHLLLTHVLIVSFGKKYLLNSPNVNVIRDTVSTFQRPNFLSYPLQRRGLPGADQHCRGHIPDGEAETVEKGPESKQLDPALLFFAGVESYSFNQKCQSMYITHG
jgi:hypothetical protein